MTAAMPRASSMLVSRVHHLSRTRQPLDGGGQLGLGGDLDVDERAVHAEHVVAPALGCLVPPRPEVDFHGDGDDHGPHEPSGDGHAGDDLDELEIVHHVVQLGVIAHSVWSGGRLASVGTWAAWTISAGAPASGENTTGRGSSGRGSSDSTGITGAPLAFAWAAAACALRSRSWQLRHGTRLGTGTSMALGIPLASFSPSASPMPKPSTAPATAMRRSTVPVVSCLGSEVWPGSPPGTTTSGGLEEEVGTSGESATGSDSRPSPLPPLPFRGRGVPGPGKWSGAPWLIMRRGHRSRRRGP